MAQARWLGQHKATRAKGPRPLHWDADEEADAAERQRRQRRTGINYHVPGGFAVGAEPVRRPGEAPREGVSSKNGWGWGA